MFTVALIINIISILKILIKLVTRDTETHAIYRTMYTSTSIRYTSTSIQLQFADIYNNTQHL